MGGGDWGFVYFVANTSTEFELLLENKKLAAEIEVGERACKWVLGKAGHKIVISLTVTFNRLHLPLIR
jgi:hypothetical protein